MPRTLTIPYRDLVKAIFVERPNRFVIRCRLQTSGDVVEAHLADPGRLIELLLPGVLLYLRQNEDPRRKTKWSVILVKAPDKAIYVSLQSTLVNQLATLALSAKAISELVAWGIKRREYSYNGSRWDFLLECSEGKQLLLEVKSCSLVHDGIAMFPDAVTERGRRHVLKLAELHSQGEIEGAVLFVVQRSDARSFQPATHIDPKFSVALSSAYAQGVQVLVYGCQVSETGIKWGEALPINFS